MLDIVASTLSHDPAFTVMTCGNGEDGCAKCATWMPHLILCDVAMQDMDGPAVLRQLRQNTSTAEIPLVFTTARAQPSDVEKLMMLGAEGVIAKPYKLKTLAQSMRHHLNIVAVASKNDGLLVETTYDFVERLRADAKTIERLRRAWIKSDYAVVPAGLQTCIHNLAGAAGTYDFESVSLAASALDDAIIELRDGHQTSRGVEHALDTLLARIRSEI